MLKIRKSGVYALISVVACFLLLLPVAVSKLTESNSYLPQIVSNGDTPTSTITPSPRFLPTNTSTAPPTLTPTNTSTSTPTLTPSNTPPPTPTNTPVPCGTLSWVISTEVILESGCHYIVTDNVLVDIDGRLIIEPGVVVKFNAGYFLKILG